MQTAGRLTSECYTAAPLWEFRRAIARGLIPCPRLKSLNSNTIDGGLIFSRASTWDSSNGRITGPTESGHEECLAPEFAHILVLPHGCNIFRRKEFCLRHES